MTTRDGIKVTSAVAVDPATAFRIFTEEIDAWWRRGPAFRGVLSDGGAMRFEPGVGGRLVESDPDGEEFEIGEDSRVGAGATPGVRMAEPELHER